MLLVCMKCVNCSILFLIPSMLSCSMFMLCVLLLGEGCGGLLGGGGGGGWSQCVSDVPVLLCVCEWGGWWSGRGWSLVSPCWLYEWCLSLWRG